jgi:hypothetical protein
MKALAWMGSLALMLGASGTALAQQAPPPPPAAVGVAEPEPVGQPPLPPGAARGAVLRGEWVDSPGYGWSWVPAGAVARSVGGNPYAYFYSPHYGWTWHASPWGWGAYHRGGWVGAHWGWGYPARAWYGHGWVHGWRR